MTWRCRHGQFIHRCRVYALSRLAPLQGGDGLFAENDRGMRVSWVPLPRSSGRTLPRSPPGRWRDADEHEGSTIAEARAEVALWRGKLAKGIDPKVKAPAKTIHIFAEAAEEFISATIDPVAKHAVHGEQWRHAFRNHAGTLMPMDVAAIKIDDVQPVLHPIWWSITLPPPVCAAGLNV